MYWALRIFGFPVLEIHADESTGGAEGGCTGGQFELSSELLSPQYEELPEDSFGFRAPGRLT